MAKLAPVKPAPVKEATPTAADNLAKARAARKPVDKFETPEARFKRLANTRLPDAVAALRSLINIAENNGKAYEGDDKDRKGTTTGYTHTEEQTKLIEMTLQPLVKELLEKLRGVAKKATTGVPTL